MKVRGTFVFSGLLIFTLFWSGCGDSIKIEQSSLYEILPNRGVIRTVFINEVVPDNLAHDGSSMIAQGFLDKGVSVCLVRNILCSGYTVRNARTCVDGSASFVDSSGMGSGLLPIGEDFWELARKFIPFNLDGYFTNVKWKNDTIHLDSLSPMERYEFIVANATSIDALRWNDSTMSFVAAESRMEVLPSGGVDTVVQFIDMGRLILPDAYRVTLDVFDSIIGGNRFSQRTHMVDWGSLCGSMDPSTCQQTMSGQLVLFAEDEHHVRTPGKLQSRVIPEHGVNGRWFHQAYLNQICSPPPMGHAAVEDPLPIKGGNMFTSDSLIFIGTDELCRFQNDARWAATIGLTVDATTTEIEDKLKGLITPYAKRIIWLGEKGLPNCLSMVSLNTLSTQPVYHIDLFFHPVGFVDKRDPLAYHFIYGTLDDKYHDFQAWDASSRRKYDSVKKRLCVTLDSLTKAIDHAGYTPVVVEVPLLMSFNLQGDVGFMSFCNGESSFGKTDDTVSRFFMPSYGYQHALRRGVKDYSTALKDAMTSVQNGMHCLVDTIPSNRYTSLSAMHCMVKVLERD